MNQQARIVLSDGKWVSVPLPKGRDPSWTPAEEFVYATCYMAAIRKNFSAKRSENIAESCVLRKVYPGIRFDNEMEKDIQFLIPE